MSTIAQEGALVLFSGGQDSATCLAWALDRFERIETLGFDYGQRHRIELDCRTPLRADIAGVGGWRGRLLEDHLVSLESLGELSETALTRDAAIGLAAALAYRRGLRHLVTGVCETDYSGYPDCRDDTLKALQVALNLGMARRFVLHTPLMWLDKAATWRLAEELGGAKLVDLIRIGSHSCYMGERATLHPWGYGCGTCPACALRQSGWERYRAEAV